ncbi:acyl-CoA dehydrogenase [Oceanobacter mangrovi]|uniref:acyl-CoA dehydrogenase n=1 Tax=Oceanobacter mangrovi TaxID=2862510 RepID=UPI001C8E5839|nr:acyl-CoA dehydrogenase [Oceanobacter mangrovi]
MSDYKHPYRDAEFVLDQLVGFDALCEAANLEGINMELAATVVEEAGKLGAGVLAPLNRVGDEKGAHLDEQGVQQTPGFKEAYDQLVEGGWLSLNAAEEFGGQGLPKVLGTAVNEIWHSANMAFALCPLLSQGAIEALTHHGSDALKRTYLPKMVSGEWAGTMNLTEPDAGSDLAAVKSKAIPDGDVYRISGTKIFITWGDHQMTENIVHLVLARLPDAPAGVKGISLFIVPKFLLDANGETTDQRNGAVALSLEHKLGIHGSPTCVMEFENAEGYLVGEANQGLKYMFTMMNDARQGVGVQGLSISERAYQLALQYSKDRLQGTLKDGSRVAIIEHPDVRRMLMVMKSTTEAMRALCLTASAELDKARLVGGDNAAEHMARAELLTPIVKGWCTEMSVELTSVGVQVHGGMGFIEETGAAQYFRDARILPIYEGTNAIQALDLIGRKMLVNGGTVLTSLLKEMDSTLEAAKSAQVLPESALTQFEAALKSALSSRDFILAGAKEDHNLAGSVAMSFLMQMGYTTGGWLMLASAIKAKAKLDAGEGDPEFYGAKLATAQFFCEHLLPRQASHALTLMAGSGSVMALSNEQF